MAKIWFWQQIITPHMAYLASELTIFGHEVTYIANSEMSLDRLSLGWEAPSLNNVSLRLATSSSEVLNLIDNAPSDAIHICEGLRGNGLVNHAQIIIKKKKLIHWVVMETVSDYGAMGWVKRLVYRYLFFIWRKNINGILAIGEKTKDWVVQLGVNKRIAYDFAYFIRESESIVNNFDRLKVDGLCEFPSFDNTSFIFIYVGQLIERKNIKLIIGSLGVMPNMRTCELWIVGDGNQKEFLMAEAAKIEGLKVIFLGALPMKDIPEYIKRADCLVLPSKHDGWGVVVSESLMVGTPVICSDACGASVVVKASSFGGVFESASPSSILRVMHFQSIKKTTEEERRALASWSKCLNSYSGAKYLSNIIKSNSINSEYINPPWIG